VCYAPNKAAVTVDLSVVPSDQPVVLVNADVFDGLTFVLADPAPAGGADAGAPRTDAATPSDAAVSDEDTLATLAEFEVMGTTGGYLAADAFIDFVRRSESGEGDRGLFEGRGPIAILLLTFLGGLALNLTPCVLPMIPINLAIIGAGSQGASRLRGFALGSAYGLAMAAVYGVLGLVVILTAGTFGAINASPWFNLGIAVLFVALALAMFDVITIDFTSLQSKVAVGGSGQKSLLIAFGMGAVAALLAGACVAPVVIQVIVFSSNLYATGTTLALGLPFLLGVGMALPWPAAGAGLSFLPKPGAWMVRVKQVLGLFILATAIYYGYLAYGLFSQRWVDAEEVTNSVEALLEEGWYGSLGEGLQTAQRENKPVLIDMWATWCKNCLVMDRTTLQDPAVKEALADFVKIKFQAEDPGAPFTGAVMAHFNAIGLPTYAIVRPR
jgi:thiol:disulfide interchange protein